MQLQNEGAPPHVAIIKYVYIYMYSGLCMTTLPKPRLSFPVTPPTPPSSAPTGTSRRWASEALIRCGHVYIYVYNMLYIHVHVHLHVYIHVLMRDEKEERKKQARSNKQTRQHSTPKAVTFP